MISIRFIAILCAEFGLSIDIFRLITGVASSFLKKNDNCQWGCVQVASSCKGMFMTIRM